MTFHEKLEIRPNIQSFVWLILIDETDETFVLLKQIFGSLFLVNMAKSRKIFSNFKKVQEKSVCHNFHVILKSR